MKGLSSTVCFLVGSASDRRITAGLLAALLLAFSGCEKEPPPDAPAPAVPTRKQAPARAQAPAPEAPVEVDHDRRAMERRAVEAVIWGIPAVNFDLMYQAMVRETHGGFNEVLFWSRLSNWRNQTLTPNPDVIYLMPFFDLSDGPIVLEIPPADDGVINGTIMDAWQTPLEDVGPAGVDKGAGAKYLILPPGHAGKIPAGYVALPSSTHHGYALLRSIPKGGGDAYVAQAVTYGRRVKLYPFAQAGNPPGTSFRDAIDVLYDATIPYDARFFEALDRFVQREAWLGRDRVMIDMLRSIGIEKGKPFSPDEAAQAVLNDAAREARALLETRYGRLFSPAYYEGTQWAVPAIQDYIEGAQTGYADPGRYPIDSRGEYFSFAFFTAKQLGEGQFYLMTIRDKDGQDFSGAKAYRLTVPPGVPVTQYWSVTAYDRQTHGLIRNLAWSSRSSQSPGLQHNPDGSVDIWFGPTAPADKESNWVPTASAGNFEVLFRFYGPQQPLFDKSWKLPDIEKVR